MERTISDSLNRFNLFVLKSRILIKFMYEKYMIIMGEPFACRVCLVTDVTLYYMHDNGLKTAYENLTGVVMMPDNLPQYLCAYCSALVRKCVAFKEKCLRSQELLKYTVMHQQVLTTDYIRSIDRASHQIILPYTVVSTHKETTDGDTIKEENLFDSNLIKTEDNEVSDEEPLSKKVEKKKKLKKHIEIKQEFDEIDFIDNQIDSTDNFDDRTVGENVIYDRSTEKEIDMVVLTKQQQLDEVLARKDSYNYQNSFYKCDKCFKGFVTDATYKNHMIRHDSSSGPEVCEICQTRWADARALRAHAATSHQRRYSCRLCDHTCKSNHKAKEHQKWHNGHKFVCKVCGSCFSKSTSYLTHLRLRHPSEHSCGECGERFISRSGLSMHAKKAHRHQKSSMTAQYKCALCQFKFRSFDALNKHTTYSENGICDSNLSSCHQCGDSFTSPELLKDHQKTHHSTVEVRCDQCGRTFAHERSYSVHYQRVHLGIKAKYKTADGRRQTGVVCEICGKKCISKATLVYHQRTHTGEKPFQCAECPKSFSVFQRLKIHIRTHTGERPFKCLHCPKAFKHKAALNRHDRVHSGAKPYTCTHCGKSFSQSNSMKLHVRTVHLKIPAPYKSRRNKNNE